MSGPEYPDAPPPEVPEEFAAAYREAYRRALGADPAADAGVEPGPEPFADPALDLPDVPPQEVVRVGTHRSEEHAKTSERAGADWRASRWVTPVLLGVGAVLLVLAAYGVGAALAGDDTDPRGSADPSVGTTTDPEPTDEPSDVQPTAKPSSSAGGWTGAVTPVTVDAISTDCTAPASNDSSGKRVTYVPENAADGKTQTAWRCSGTAVGETLTLRLAGESEIGEVGLVPGYAKTDPESGVDRYAENNRITRVRWTLADGVSVVQRLDPDPSSRAVQLLRVPLTETDTITLEILAVKRGPRNTTAISEVSLSAAD
jgi:hypothetical protein